MMFVSFACQYRRVLFSRISKPRHLTTVYSPPNGTSIPCDMCAVYAHAGQWQLGKVKVDNNCIDNNTTLFVGLDEKHGQVNMSLDLCCDTKYPHLDLGVELDDNNADKRLSEFFHHVRSMKMIDGKEYYDMPELLSQVKYPFALSKSAHTQFVSLEPKIQQLIQHWDLRQVALKSLSTNCSASDYKEIGTYELYERWGELEEMRDDKNYIIDQFEIDWEELESRDWDANDAYHAKKDI